jgi:threonine dehydrogenase-like Zn-dependent dehydrogenase
MRATVMYGAGDVRVETVPDARQVEPTDAVVRVTRAAICGSDLWPYKSMRRSQTGRRVGHELIGVIDSVGSDVQTLKVGQLVIAPFLISDGTCGFCREGLQSSCVLTAGDMALTAWTGHRARRCACPGLTEP